MPRRLQLGALAAFVFLFGLLACSDQSATAPPLGNDVTADVADPSLDTLIPIVRQLAASRGVTALERPAAPRVPLVRLGQVLAFDKLLSGNRDIACMTCHLPAFATGDGRSLSVGQGGNGLGPTRTHAQGHFIGRNAPPLFNLSQMTSFFWDGRVSRGSDGVLHMPAGTELTAAQAATLEFGALSAQGLIPLLSRSEMRGDSGNELADIPDDRPTEVWEAIMRRIRGVPAYRGLFEAAYPGERFEDMTLVHASNAIAAFFVARLTFTDSPWDRFLRGDDRALGPTELRGARNFLAFSCAKCHSGPALSDNGFHNALVPQFGPGAGHGPDGRDDYGRMGVTGNAAERYAFRTPPLRNVELTGPYGHDGAIADLRDFVDHYSEIDAKLRSFDPGTLEPLLQGTVLPTTDAILATRDPLLGTTKIADERTDETTAFLKALTDPAARNLRKLRPTQVPSGLPVD
jgi:cytochrome c peroxidase